MEEGEKLNFDNEIIEKFLLPKGKPIVATKLSELQGREERENMNCGNQVAENGRKKKLWQPKNCGNDIAEMEGKKICGN